MAFSAREVLGGTMTEEATDAPAAAEQAPAPAVEEKATDASLEKKFRTIPGEEILRHTRPSFMAFAGYYVLAMLMMALHWLFYNDNLAGLLTSEDSSGFAKLLFGFLANDVTFMGVMLALTWFNRMLNINTSNRWLTFWLLLASVAPLLVILDNSLTAIVGDGYPSIGSDGGLLNGFFPDHHLWPPHLVAWKRTVSKFKMVWTDFSVSAVDFTGRPKPWHLSWLRRADPVDKVYYLPLFLEWWEKWFAYRKALPGSGGGASIHHWALGPL